MVLSVQVTFKDHESEGVPLNETFLLISFFFWVIHLIMFSSFPHSLICNLVSVTECF